MLTVRTVLRVRKVRMARTVIVARVSVVARVFVLVRAMVDELVGVVQAARLVRAPVVVARLARALLVVLHEDLSVDWVVRFLVHNVV